MRVRLSDRRLQPPVEPLFNIPINRQSFGAPGTSYFLPVNDLTPLYINGLLEIFNEQVGAFVVDERASFLPAGLKKFAKSRGGHLHDDPASGRVVTISLVERMVSEFVTAEQGMIIQNLALMAEALGLGGYPNFANHEFGWFQALGFNMQTMPSERYLGANFLIRSAVKLLKQSVPVPFPVSLEAGGERLLAAYAPPNFNDMEAAVRAVLARKTTAMSLKAGAGAWIGGEEPTVAPISERAIEATVAYCNYVFERYGRFPAHPAPFRTVLGFQVGYVDADFYKKFYRGTMLGERHWERFRQTTGEEGRRG
jgi:hypothetical protein